MYVCTYVQIKHSLAFQQTLIFTLAGVVAYYFIPAKVGINPLMAKYSDGLYNDTENHFIESTTLYNP